MGNNFNLPGSSLESGNSEENFYNQRNYLNSEHQGADVSNYGTLPSYLENWYQDVQAYPAPPAFKIHRKPSSRHKIKSLLKNSLQILTVVILILTAGILGGFVFLDRKLNLNATQASLNNMSEALALGSQDLSQSGEAVSQSQIESEARVPEISKIKGEKTVFGASGNNNVDIRSLPSDIDTDQDGISDEVEEKLSTNPFLADTDGDGYPDGVEVENGYDPKVPAKKSATTYSSENYIPPQVESASTSSSSCSLNSENSEASSCAVSQDYSTSQESDFSSLSGDDYTALQQLGLSQEDIDRAASGNVSNVEKIGMQEKILGSSPMQDSIGGMIDAVPKASLPEVSDSELNLFRSDRKEDIVRYFEDLDNIFEKNFSGIVELNSTAVRSNIANGNYQELEATHNALEKTYQDLKNLPTPEDVKDIHKSFVIMFQLYADLVSVENAASDNPDQVTLILAKIKSFEDLQPMMEQAFENLNSKYGLE